MNIFDFAINMEKEGEALYRELAGNTPDKGLKTILNMLANDEKKHAQVIRKMKDAADPDMAETRVLKDAKNVFVRMKETMQVIATGITQVGLYQKAQELELKSENFYRQKALEIGEEKQKIIFQKIADEEKKHYQLLHHIIELVSRPENWVENAEFFKIDEY